MERERKSKLQQFHPKLEQEKLMLSESLDDPTVEAFEEQADLLGTEVHIISTESREGAQLRDMGKIVGILRYRLAQ